MFSVTQILKKTHSLSHRDGRSTDKCSVHDPSVVPMSDSDRKPTPYYTILFISLRFLHTRRKALLSPLGLTGSPAKRFSCMILRSLVACQREDHLILPLKEKSYDMPELCYLVSDHVSRKARRTEPHYQQFTLLSTLTISHE